MDEDTLKIIAAQLRQPKGQHAVQVGEKMNEGNLHINLNTFGALKLRASDNILEIGMGNGFFVKNILLADDSIKYTGCDFSEAMVEEARKQNEAFTRAGQAEFYVADVNELPFNDGSFDKVFSINTIYFWDNLQVALSEIWRVLKPNGQITISVRPRSVMEHYPFVKYGFAMFTKDDLVELLAGNRFTVTGILEKDEPEIELDGVKIQTATLLVNAEKY
ncbi:MAG: class I SAM-dependent methyltransferase [Bacteroidota bacterium]